MWHFDDYLQTWKNDLFMQHFDEDVAQASLVPNYYKIFSLSWLNKIL